MHQDAKESTLPHHTTPHYITPLLHCTTPYHTPPPSHTTPHHPLHTPHQPPSPSHTVTHPTWVIAELITAKWKPTTCGRHSHTCRWGISLHHLYTTVSSMQCIVGGLLLNTECACNDLVMQCPSQPQQVEIYHGCDCVAAVSTQVRRACLGDESATVCLVGTFRGNRPCQSCTAEACSA